MAHYQVVLKALSQSNGVAMRADLSALPASGLDESILFACVTYYSGITVVRGSQTEAETIARRNTDGWETLRAMTAGGEGGWAEADGLTGEAWYDEGYTNSWGYGSEIEFCRRLRETYEHVACIKYAVGGTQLSSGDEDWAAPDGALYVDWLEYVNARLNELIAEGHTYEIVAMITYQGESDPTNLAGREPALRRFIEVTRARLKSQFKVIINRVRINAHVRDADEKLSREIPGVAWVDTDDLPIFTDGIHIWQDGHVTLGNRDYTAFTGE